MDSDSEQGPDRRPTRGRHRALVLGGLVAGLGLAAAAGDEPASQAADTRALLEKWVETRRILSKEAQDLALAKETLGDRIDLVQREIDTLRARISEAQASLGDADKKRADLLAEAEAFTATQAALATAVTALEERVRVLLPRLPDPVRERIRPLSQRLPEPATAAAQPLGKRFESVVGILNEVDRSQRELTATSEVRELGNGTTAEVTALYVGIGQGFYAASTGGAAGVGRSSAEGWTWESTDGAQADIARAIAILKGEQLAEFVRLPVTVE